VTLTNGAGCDSWDGAYGTAWAWDDVEAGVGTIGNQNAGCQVRKIDSAYFYYGGSWHYGGSSGYNTSNTYIYSPEIATEATGSHRICGVGPVCGSNGQTHAYQ
jgi:hypothetical protein